MPRRADVAIFSRAPAIILRFENQKGNVAKTGGLVTVKVSGMFKAEGFIVRNLIKDGTYTVTGE